MFELDPEFEPNSTSSDIDFSDSSDSDDIPDASELDRLANQLRFMVCSFMRSSNIEG